MVKAFRTTVASETERPDFTPNLMLPRHRWYRFKEGFSAGLVQSFIGEYLTSDKKARVLDPFLGSGTTALEGSRLGHTVVGIETNPFMAFLARVKLENYDQDAAIEETALQCINSVSRKSEFTLPNDTTLVERRGLSKWLLNTSVAKRYEQLRTAIAKVNCKNVRDLLLLGLIASIEEVANARKDGKCWRYKTNWKKLNYDQDSIDNAFANQVLQYADDIAECPKLAGRSHVFIGDARRFELTRETDKSFDGILTSPPYLNSFDYTDIYRPELLLLNHARNSRELRKIRFRTVRSHVQVAWQACPPLKLTLLEKKIKEIREKKLWNDRIPDMVNGYFVDLDKVVERCAKHLRKGARAGFVIADSAYSGVVIPVDLILAEILERRGLRVMGARLFRNTLGNGHHQSRSSEQLKEVMLVAEYRGPKSRRVA